ncbi:MAG: glycosyl transferase, partial [Snowella sp.]
MKILFIHQNFPGQFKHLAPALASQGHEVLALTTRQESPSEWQGVKLIPYRPNRSSTPNIHPWLIDFETKTIRAEAVFYRAKQLKAQGLNPDLIISNPGWGESLFVKEVWPQAKLAIYCEFFYQVEGGDVGFDPEFPQEEDTIACRLRLKNLNNLLHFEVADAGLSPTEWQANSFPSAFRQRITVIHDG